MTVPPSAVVSGSYTGGEQGLRGPKGPRGKAADTSAMASRIATLERQLELLQQVQASGGFESPSSEPDVSSYGADPDVSSYGGDLDCSDYPTTDFATPHGDPNGLDGDGDGIACES